MAPAVLVGFPPAAVSPPTAALLLAAAAALTYLLIRTLSSIRRYRQLDIPEPPAVSTLLGHAPQMLTDTTPVLMASWVAQYGPLFKMRALDRPLVVVADPASIARINR